MIKAPPGPARKDNALSHVIISETKDKAIAKHQVNIPAFCVIYFFQPGGIAICRVCWLVVWFVCLLT